jgi:hypothetical protein
MVTVGIAGSVLSFGTGLLDNLVKGFMPNIHLPSKLPTSLPTKTATIAPKKTPEPTPQSAAKNFAGGVGRVIPLVAGLYLGDKVADAHGEDLGGDMISQGSDECYTETMDGITRMPCADAKKAGSK